MPKKVLERIIEIISRGYSDNEYNGITNVMVTLLCGKLKRSLFILRADILVDMEEIARVVFLFDFP